MIGGFQGYYLRASFRVFIMRNMPFSMISDLIQNMPSNVTTYLSKRSTDLFQREDTDLLTWSINVDQSTGLDSQIPPYSTLDPAFVLAIIKAINTTVGANILSEPSVYIETKQEYLTELATRYQEWYNGARYTTYTKDNKKKANIAAMSLVMSDLMQFGYEEQAMVKAEVKDIYETCIGKRKVVNNRMNCYLIPKTSDWKEADINKVLPGVPSGKIRKRGNKKINQLTWAIRNKRHLFYDYDGTLDMNNGGYAFYTNKTFSRE